jgi:hypothetical protein
MSYMVRGFLFKSDETWPMQPCLLLLNKAFKRNDVS